MNVFKAIAKPFTATARLLRLRRNAVTLIDVAEEGAADRALYRSSAYWARLFAAGRVLWIDLPLPQEIKDMDFVRNMLTNYKTTLGGIAALAAGVAAVANDPGKITDPVVLGLFGAAWAAFNAKDNNVTGGTKPATEEAQARVTQ